MPLTPIVGALRLRQFQLGLESTFKTPVAATRRLPWQMTGWNPLTQTWTFPTTDTGTLDEAQAPYGLGSNATAAFGGPLASNDAPTVISAGVMGGLTPGTSGTSHSLTASPASLTQDVFDTYTMEWGDDSTDVFQMAGTVINDFMLTYPQDQGPIQLATNWLLAAGDTTYPASFTGGLNVDAAPVYLYCADTEFYINDTAGAIETTKLSNIAYGASFQVNNNLDAKRFANGSNTRMQVANYGRGLRKVTFTLTGAKQTAWIAEATKWIAANPTERFFGIKTTSTVAASAGIPHSLDIRMPGYWLTRSEQTIVANTGFDLVAENIYDPTLTYPFWMKSVSTRATL
jgi:hypothetical protein